jgi:hypothetical protein
MGNIYTRASFQTIAGTFGKPFAQAVFDLPLNQWQGPVESFRGIHYVRVTGNHEPELPPFDQMESYLRTDYLLTKGRESRLSGYSVPVIEKVMTEKQKLPVISALLFFSVLIRFIFSIRKKGISFGRPVLISLIGVGFILYPFYRIPFDFPFIMQWTPSIERTSNILDGLLTNVYRAFNVRNENRVYDRLAVSVMGDQLTQIYLQNRQSLDIENRGGVCANADEVNILFVNKVKRANDDGFVADTVWTVSGSVSHFGHTHYRRNKNHALVTFVMDGDSWKIKDIEVIEEKRLL